MSNRLIVISVANVNDTPSTSALESFLALQEPTAADSTPDEDNPHALFVGSNAQSISLLVPDPDLDKDPHEKLGWTFFRRQDGNIFINDSLPRS